jgi:EF hand domain-containing protein
LFAPNTGYERSMRSIVVALVLVGVASLAGAEKLDTGVLIQKLDSDHDGMVSREELRNASGDRLHYLVDKLFEAADKNHDGKLDKAELNSSGANLLWLFQLSLMPTITRSGP